MTPQTPYDHSHWACDPRIAVEGGQITCCACDPHPNCLIV